MKYKPYKEIERPYFNLQESVYFLAALTLIPAFISYGLFFVGGIPLAIVFNLIISFIGFFYFHFYGKSSQHISLEFLVGWFLVFGYFSIVDYGFYLIYQYQKTNYFNNLHFYIWAFVVFGLPVFYFVFRDLKYVYMRVSMASNYIKTRMKIIHDPDFHISIHKINFINTKTKRISNIRLEKQHQHQSVQIPVNADLLLVTWYSFVENKYYESEIAFPFNKLVLTTVKYPTNEPSFLRGKETSNLKLYLSLNGSTELFNKDTHFASYSKSKSIAISESEKEKKFNDYPSNFSRNDFIHLLNEIRNSNRIEKNIEINNKQFVWNFTFESAFEENKIEILDTSLLNDEIVQNINLPLFRHLPKTIKVIYRQYLWARINIDSEKLYTLLKNTLGKDEDTLVSFFILFKNTDGDLDFYIRINDQEIDFKDWKIEIDEHGKATTDQRLKRIQEHEDKNSLYKKAWPLINEKKYDEAQKICDKLIQTYPDFGFAYFLEVRLLWYKQGSQACFDKLDYFMERTKDDHYALAHMYNNFGCLLDLEFRFEEALDYFLNAAITNPEEGTYHCNIAEIYCKLKQPKKAMVYALKSKEKGHQSQTLNEILESEGTKVF